MRFPDTIIVLRPTESDAYGNELANFDDPAELPQPGWEAVRGSLLLLPKTADVQQGDRFRVGEDTYAGDVLPVRSTTALKMYTVRLTRLED